MLIGTPSIYVCISYESQVFITYISFSICEHFSKLYQTHCFLTVKKWCIWCTLSEWRTSFMHKLAPSRWRWVCYILSYTCLLISVSVNFLPKTRAVLEAKGQFLIVFVLLLLSFPPMFCIYRPPTLHILHFTEQ